LLMLLPGHELFSVRQGGRLDVAIASFLSQH